MFSVSIEKLQDIEALSGELHKVYVLARDRCGCFFFCSELTNNLWQSVLPGLRERVKDPTCSDQLAELLGNFSGFSLEWYVSG